MVKREIGEFPYVDRRTVINDHVTYSFYPRLSIFFLPISSLLLRGLLESRFFLNNAAGK